MDNHQACFTLTRGGGAPLLAAPAKPPYHIGGRPRQSGVWLRIGRLSGVKRLGMGERYARFNFVLTHLSTAFDIVRRPFEPPSQPRGFTSWIRARSAMSELLDHQPLSSANAFGPLSLAALYYFSECLD